MSNDHLNRRASYLLDLETGQREPLMSKAIRVVRWTPRQLASKNDGMRSSRLQRIADRFRRRFPKGFGHLRSLADYKGQLSTTWSKQPTEEALEIIQQVWESRIGDGGGDVYHSWPSGSCITTTKGTALWAAN